MACSIDFIEFVCRTLEPLGEVRYRKMMGDYVIYLNDKCVITACDNIIFIKKLPCIDHLMANADTGHPYPDAKECYILSFDNQAKARNIIQTLWEVLPFPKKTIKSKN